jgi:hypothetical protein
MLVELVVLYHVLCTVFCTTMNLGERTGAPLQGGGRWFESSIAHYKNTTFAEK